MAAVGRTGETSAVGSNIYDNTNKEITPAKVRAALAVLIESNFNLVDDELKNLKYDGSNTLAQVISPRPLVGTVTGINVGGADSYGVTGIVSSAITIAFNGTDSNLDVNFSVDISAKILNVTLFYTSGDYNSNNDVCMPVIRRVSGTKLAIGLRKVSAGATNITLQITAQ